MVNGLCVILVLKKWSYNFIAQIVYRDGSGP
jgi:hypothetical protein